jgi:hypothetical protein
MNSKPVPLGPPLVSTEAELAALEQPTQAEIDAALAHWLKYAPARAKGMLYAQVEDVLGNAEATNTATA